MKVFDWDKAAGIIKEKLKTHAGLKAEAGLEGDWAETGEVIFENGKPTNDEYTYLASNWANPTLVIEYDDTEDNSHTDESFECYCELEGSRFNEKSKWDKQSLEILGINI